MAMMRVEIKMYDTRKTQQHRAKTKKIGMKYVKLAVLFGLLLCWKVIYLISQPLGDSWANFLAYCWIFSIMFLYLKVTKQTLAKFFYSISMKLRSEEHTSELQSRFDLVCRLLLEKKNKAELMQALYNYIISYGFHNVIT